MCHGLSRSLMRLTADDVADAAVTNPLTLLLFIISALDADGPRWTPSTFCCGLRFRPEQLPLPPPSYGTHRHSSAPIAEAVARGNHCPL